MVGDAGAQTVVSEKRDGRSEFHIECAFMPLVIVNILKNT